MQHSAWVSTATQSLTPSTLPFQLQAWSGSHLMMQLEERGEASSKLRHTQQQRLSCIFGRPTRGSNLYFELVMQLCTGDMRM
jgi:hypothetical protein